MGSRRRQADEEAETPFARDNAAATFDGVREGPLPCFDRVYQSSVALTQGSCSATKSTQLKISLHPYQRP
jgi:hypothetical protein